MSSSLMDEIFQSNNGIESICLRAGLFMELYQRTREASLSPSEAQFYSNNLSDSILSLVGVEQDFKPVIKKLLELSESNQHSASIFWAISKAPAELGLPSLAETIINRNPLFSQNDWIQSLRALGTLLGNLSSNQRRRQNFFSSYPEIIELIKKIYKIGCKTNDEVVIEVSEELKIHIL